MTAVKHGDDVLLPTVCYGKIECRGKIADWRRDYLRREATSLVSVCALCYQPALTLLNFVTLILAFGIMRGLELSLLVTSVPDDQLE